mmetsp:Transcript_7840/g.24221  ORF Transcript_7840/g.24221 Transcript_7840/m.24221 type:complete len:204 (-) Transcript_7840:338-949(-)
MLLLRLPLLFASHLVCRCFLATAGDGPDRARLLVDLGLGVRARSGEPPERARGGLRGGEPPRCGHSAAQREGVHGGRPRRRSRGHGAAAPAVRQRGARGGHRLQHGRQHPAQLRGRTRRHGGRHEHLPGLRRTGGGAPHREPAALLQTRPARQAKAVRARAPPHPAPAAGRRPRARRHGSLRAGAPLHLCPAAGERALAGAVF